MQRIAAILVFLALTVHASSQRKVFKDPQPPPIKEPMTDVEAQRSHYKNLEEYRKVSHWVHLFTTWKFSDEQRRGAMKFYATGSKGARDMILGMTGAIASHGPQHDRQATKILLIAAKSPDYTIRITAAGWLRRWHTADVDAAMTKLRSDEDPRVRAMSRGDIDGAFPGEN